MDKKIAKKWIEALRSGKYKQGSGYLCAIKGKSAKYCCLGVLCHILETPYKKRGEVKAYGNSDTALLPKEVVKNTQMNSPWGTLRSNYSISLTHLNDNGKTFKEIADFIEQNVEEL